MVAGRHQHCGSAGRRLSFLALAMSLAVSIFLWSGCGGGGNRMNAQGESGGGAGPGEVVLFTSLDQIFSEPIAQAFTRKTGIAVKFQGDAEAAKTVGLVNRLISRKEHPEADVFWNNEWAQTRVLKNQGVTEAYLPRNTAGLPASAKDPKGWWTGFAARGRVILYNTEMVKKDEVPARLADLTDSRYKGRVAIARPLFGTTFTHAAVLFSKWGDVKAKAFFKALKANDVKIAAGNAHARNLVMDGEVAICLTDTDDANGAFLKGRPVEMIYPDQGEGGEGAVVIPNTVALIKGGPNTENGKKLIDFLVSPEVEALLAKGESAQIPLRTDIAPYSDRYRIDRIKVMDVDWEDVATRFEAVKAFIQQELMW